MSKVGRGRGARRGGFTFLYEPDGRFLVALMTALSFPCELVALINATTTQVFRHGNSVPVKFLA